jgi:hypothetical protein
MVKAKALNGEALGIIMFSWKGEQRARGIEITDCDFKLIKVSRDLSSPNLAN